MLTNRKTYKKSNLRDVQKTFNDGICEIYKANERRIEKLIGRFCFAYESVGVSQFYQAHINNISVDCAISIPLNNYAIDSQFLLKIGDGWYKIVRVQFKDDKKPRYRTLSLTRSPFSYEEVVNDN